MTATVEVTLARSPDRAAWSAFVAASPGGEAGHRWEYLDLLERIFGLETLRLVARRGSDWLGVLPLVHQRSFVGRFLTSVPYLNHGGVLGRAAEGRRALATEAEALAERLGADRLELRGRDGSDLPIGTWAGKAGYGLDLPADAEHLWRGLGSKIRAQVKRPRKEGYEARVVREGGRRRFYPLLARRWHELGSPVVPEGFFEGLEAAFAGDLEYVLVERNGHAAAAGVLLRVGDRVEIPWASSASEHDRFGVNMLLYWTALERAIERGARRFDFGRSTPGTGNARFKLQWGAEEKPLLWSVRVRDGRGRAAERGDRRRGLAATAWRRLPAFVTARLGPVLAARIPY